MYYVCSNFKIKKEVYIDISVEKFFFLMFFKWIFKLVFIILVDLLGFGLWSVFWIILCVDLI